MAATVPSTVCRTLTLAGVLFAEPEPVLLLKAEVESGKPLTLALPAGEALRLAHELLKNPLLAVEAHLSPQVEEQPVLPTTRKKAAG